MLLRSDLMMQHAIDQILTPTLDLETTRSSAATSALELATLALDIWLLVRVRTKAEVLHSLTSVLWTTEQTSVSTSWCALWTGQYLTYSDVVAASRLPVQAHRWSGTRRRPSQCEHERWR